MTTRQIEYYEHLLETERDHAAKEHEDGKAAEIQRTIDALHADPKHYGLCIVCGRAIDQDRLRIVPATRYCEDDADVMWR